MKILRERNRPVRDYTTVRLGTRSERGRKIARCPKCGRKGAAARYTDGGQMFAHRSEFDGLTWSVIDHCYIGASVS